MSDLATELDTGLRELARAQPDGSAQISLPVQTQMLHFVQLLMKWNRVYNLTAIRDADEMIHRHLLDSLVLCRWLPAAPIELDGVTDVIDLGSGAGLPVLPLAMARPDLTFCSIESNGKKTRFQQQALVELGITNVKVINDRVENVQASGAMLTSRAFAAPHDFLSMAKPLCASGAQVVLMLGRSERMPESLPEPFRLQELVPVDIPGNSAARHVAVCRCEA